MFISNARYRTVLAALCFATPLSREFLSRFAGAGLILTRLCTGPRQRTKSAKNTIVILRSSQLFLVQHSRCGPRGVSRNARCRRKPPPARFVLFQPVTETGSVRHQRQVDGELSGLRRGHQRVAFPALMAADAALRQLLIEDCHPQMQAVDHEKRPVHDARIDGRA